MSATPGFLPYAHQTIEADDVDAVAAALRHDYLTTGPTVGAFEKAFATAVGAEHAVACNSGTAALHLAVLALDLRPGDAVVVPSITFLATANVVRMAGADVVFADVDADTGLLTAETLVAALDRAKTGGRTIRAAIPVHLNGQVCDMEALAATADGVAMVEDACHALGEADVGATRHAVAACFSTHPAKGITTGEGGVVTTASAEFAERMQELRNHGMRRGADRMSDRSLSFDGAAANPWSYEMSEIGWNYRLPDVLCALGMSQLKKLQRFFARRRQIAALYDQLLAPLAPIVRPVPHGNRPHGWHLYATLIDFPRFGLSRATLMEKLRQAGIGTQVHYIPVHRQPYYRGLYGELSLPGADAYYVRCLSLPFFPSMTDEDVRRVVDALTSLGRR